MTHSNITGKITVKLQTGGKYVIVDGNLRWKSGLKAGVFKNENVDELVKKGIVEIIP